MVCPVSIDLRAAMPIKLAKTPALLPAVSTSFFSKLAKN
jgi:hypothetical protein